MTSIKTPDLLEERLRSSLADLRPSDGVPEQLRSRILAMPARSDQLEIFSVLRGGRGAVAVLAAVAGMAAIAVLAISYTPIGRLPPGGGAPAPSFDPTVEGPGLVTSLVPLLPVVEWVLAATLGLAALMALQAYRRSHHLWSLAAAGMAIAVAIGLGWLTTVQGVGVGGWNGYGPVLGLTPDSSHDTSGGHIQQLDVAVGPGDPFVFVFVVHNTGPIPVTVQGIVEDPEAATRIIPRWTALAFGTNPNAIGQPIEQLEPFNPVALQPGSDLTLYVVGKASACAAGPGASSVDRTYTIRGPEIELAYSVMGLAATSTYSMPVTISEPLIDGCTG